jgi:hypothetical protein
VTPYAITASTLMGVWQQLSSPEQIANWLSKMEQQYARVAEVKLLDQIRAQSYVFSAGAGGQGIWTTLQALLAHVDNVVANANRDTVDGYVMLAPHGFLKALAADEGMRGMSNNLGVAAIRGILRDSYGIEVVEVYESDSTVASAANSAATNLPGLGGSATVFTQSTNSPDKYPLYLLDASQYTMGHSSVVDAGYYREGDLVRQNLVRYFWEGMEFLEKDGEKLSFTFELLNCPSGAAPALTDAPDCDSAL